MSAVRTTWPGEEERGFTAPAACLADIRRWLGGIETNGVRLSGLDAHGAVSSEQDVGVAGSLFNWGASDSCGFLGRGWNTRIASTT